MKLGNPYIIDTEESKIFLGKRKTLKLSLFKTVIKDMKIE